MLFRCRWCERAFCEDCLDFEKTDLVGDITKEYEMLEYPAHDNAFYVQCHKCTEHFEESPEDKAIVDLLAADIDREYERAVAAAALVDDLEAYVQAAVSPTSHAGSLSDGTTIETPGVATPAAMAIDEDGAAMSRGKLKRKAAVAAVGSIKKMRVDYD
jgi:SWI/SNF-related matrix-associated actin-dependent regulator of chromatin subfamily A member 5